MAEKADKLHIGRLSCDHSINTQIGWYLIEVNIPVSLNIYLKIFICMWGRGWGGWMCVCVQVPVQGRRRYQITWSWSSDSCELGAGNWSRIHCKSNSYPQLLSHHSSPNMDLFCSVLVLRLKSGPPHRKYMLYHWAMFRASLSFFSVRKLPFTLDSCNIWNAGTVCYNYTHYNLNTKSSSLSQA